MRKFKRPEARPNQGRPRSHSGAPPPRGRPVAGIHAVRELLRVRPRSVTHFWLKDSYAGHPDLADLAEMAATHRLKPTIQAVSALDRISSSHQGVVAYSNETPEFDFNAIKQKPRATLVVLDEVEDPHNLGAVLRTAWLFGAAAVLTPASRAAPLTATVAKVAQGAAEHVPVVQESGLLETLKQLKQEGFWLFGLAHKGSSPLYRTEIPDKVIWVLGSESSGIRKPLERECDQLVSIPQTDAAASFNVSVAAAIALAETHRQHGAY